MKIGFPKKEKKKSRSKMRRVVTLCFLLESVRVITQKEFLQGHRDLKTNKKYNLFLKKKTFSIRRIKFFFQKKYFFFKKTYEYFLFRAPSEFQVLAIESKEYSLVPVLINSWVAWVMNSLNWSIHLSSSTTVDLDWRVFWFQKI